MLFLEYSFLPWNAIRFPDHIGWKQHNPSFRQCGNYLIGRDTRVSNMFAMIHPSLRKISPSLRRQPLCHTRGVPLLANLQRREYQIRTAHPDEKFIDAGLHFVAECIKKRQKQTKRRKYQAPLSIFQAVLSIGGRLSNVHIVRKSSKTTGYFGF